MNFKNYFQNLEGDFINLTSSRYLDLIDINLEELIYYFRYKLHIDIKIDDSIDINFINSMSYANVLNIFSSYLSELSSVSCSIEDEYIYGKVNNLQCWNNKEILRFLANSNR